MLVRALHLLCYALSRGSVSDSAQKEGLLDAVTIMHSRQACRCTCIINVHSSLERVFIPLENVKVSRLGLQLHLGKTKIKTAGL